MFILLSIGIGVLYDVAFAQPSRRLFGHLGVNEGLLHNNVLSILQDSRGYLWIATYDGLNRYDGQNLRAFRHDKRDSSSLARNFVTFLCEDRNKTLWATTIGGGLCAYNRFTETFTTYRAPDTTFGRDFHLGHNDMNCLLEDRSGTLWVGTKGGLKIFDRKSKTFKTLLSDVLIAQIPTAKRPAATGLQTADILSLHLGKVSGKLWVGCRAGGLHEYDSAAKRFVSYSYLLDDPIEPKRLPPNKNTTNYNVYAIHEDRFGTVWIGSDNGRLNGLNSTTKRFASYKFDRDHTDNLSPNAVQAIYEDSLGRLWVGTSDGLFLFDRVRGIFSEMHRHNPYNPRSITDNIITCITEDASHVMWAGSSRKGLNILDLKAQRFTTYQAEVGNANSLTDNLVSSIHQDQRGLLWITSRTGGLQKYNPQSSTYTRYLYDANNPQHRAASLRRSMLQTNSLRSAVSDRYGNIWIATTSDGLTHLDYATGRFTTFLQDTSTPSGISSSWMRTLLYDRRGRLWIGTKAGGLCMTTPLATYSGQGKGRNARATFTVYRHQPTDNYRAVLNDVFALHEDRAGNIWLGTNKGLCLLDTARKFYNVVAAGGTSVVAILEDKRGWIWAGTIGTGLRLVRSVKPENVETQIPAVNSSEIRDFREADGLPSDTIYGLLEDEHGNIWAATGNGIAKLSIEQHTDGSFKAMRSQHYQPSDGIAGSQSMMGAYCVGHAPAANGSTISGVFYFGSTDGITAFHPDSVRDNPFAPRVVLTDFRKFNASVKLDTVIGEKRHLKLTYKDSFISFGFAALEYTASAQNRCAYKLEGFDKDWVDIGSKREATYTNLEAGEYRFRVKACNNDGVWNEEGVSLLISVEPPWWQQWWFRLSAFCLTGGAIVIAYKRRVRSIKQRNAQLERQVQERTMDLQEANTEIQRQLLVQAEQAAEIQAANTKLQEQNVELLDLSNEKNEIMGIVAHDLKNPIGSVRGFAELIENGFVDDKEAPVIAKHIVTTANRMLELVSNLLDSNRLDSGGIQFQMVHLDIAPIVESTIWQYQHQAEAKSITLHYSAEYSLEGSTSLVFADEQATMQIIDNLISNAVKYSPHGKNVFVRLKPSGHSFNENSVQPIAQVTNAQMIKGFLCVEVQDEGDGISPEDMKKLFGKFARLSAQPTGGEHSTGLGLSIVKKMVEAMHGRVWCESELGKGATFIVELPKSA